ncbi:hypothetical protein GPECTOR_14g18 [Gonium pectorale]|uniref:Trichohyalin-plectin-homology domain-containing protein n=1 Tax=Gonium pectorale TaxID=33097 RepID=A0A150GMB0_GONPE|nr:hypothetical protein GPECTOR_14g18 [Gonium pectorale]|eukprot:KXZ50934.1 hypothetical protein GPECTOR_14g18 [Gonium pectorale]
MKPEYFGPSVVPDKKEYPTRMGSGSLRFTSRAQQAALEALARTAQMAPDGEVRTVFMPTKEQMPVCAAAGERRANVAASEWALLDTLEVTLAAAEREAAARAARAAKQQQRAALDRQLSEVQRAKAAAEAAKLVDRQEVMATVAAHHTAQRQRMESTRAAALQVKADRENMLAEARAQREAALAARREEDAKVVARAAAELEAEKAAAAARLAAARERAARDMAENEALRAARRQAEAAQRQADTETSRRMAETMLAQEHARDGAAEAIQAAVIARAGRAGTKALDDKRALIEREERLIAEAAKEAERRDAERAAAEAEKRARQKAEAAAVNAALIRAKAENAAAQREAEARARAAAEARSASELTDAERALLASREKVKLTKRIVASQREENHIKAKYDDIFMTDKERQLNARLLEAAVATVGEPKQLTIKFR